MLLINTVKSAKRLSSDGGKKTSTQKVKDPLSFEIWILRNCQPDCDHDRRILVATTSINVRKYRRAIKKGQSRKTGNTGHTRRRKTKQKHHRICTGHHYTQPNTTNVNKTCKQLDVKTKRISPCLSSFCVSG